MKRIIQAVVLCLILSACSQKQVDVPAVIAPTTFASYKDGYISIINIKAKQTNTRQVTFSFATEFEKDLASIEVYSGETEKTLCQIFIENKTTNSAQLKNYVVTDLDPKGRPTYYIVKYTTKLGEWFCTPLYAITMQ